MAAATGAALLRSVARKMARAPPPHHRRFLAAEIHGRCPGPAPAPPTVPRSSRLFSSSTCGGSKPSPTTNKDPHIQNEQVPSEFGLAKDRFRRARIFAAYFLLFGGLFYYGSVKPAYEKLKKDIQDDASRRRLKMKDEIIQAMMQEYGMKHIEAKDALADSYEAKGMQTSTQGKEHDGHQASDEPRSNYQS